MRRPSRPPSAAWIASGGVYDPIHELLATEAALDKLGARNISSEEAGQLARNRHLAVRNPSANTSDMRRLMIGTTDGGRGLTLVIERTLEPTTGSS